MNEALAEELREIYESLADEQKEQVGTCDSVAELDGLAQREGIELPGEMLDYLREDSERLSLDDLDAVAGGFGGSRNRKKKYDERPSDRRRHRGW